MHTLESVTSFFFVFFFFFFFFFILLIPSCCHSKRAFIGFGLISHLSRAVHSFSFLFLHLFVTFRLIPPQFVYVFMRLLQRSFVLSKASRQGFLLVKSMGHIRAILKKKGQKKEKRKAVLA